MKLFKKLAVICLSLTMCLGLGASLAACGGSDDAPASSSAPQTEIAYKFKIVKADDQPAAGYYLLLCKGVENCGVPVQADENGIVEYPVSKLPTIDGEKKAGVFDVHVMEAMTSSEHLDLVVEYTTPTTFTTSNPITIKLK